MRTIACLAVISWFGGGCFNSEEVPPEPMNLDAATRPPLLFSQSIEYTKNCPFPGELEDLNRFGDSGTLNLFRLDGFYIGDDGDNLSGNITLAFAGADYLDGEQLAVLPPAWSVHVLGPRMWEGDECSQGPVLVLGAPLSLHRQFVVPFSADTYCVAAFFEIEEGFLNERCSGDRVGDVAEWNEAIDALDPK